MYDGIGGTLWWQGVFQVVDLQGCRLREDHISPFESQCTPNHQEQQCCKGLMDNDLIRDDVKMEMHVLGVQYGCVEVEIGEVDSKKLGPRCTDGGIDE